MGQCCAVDVCVDGGVAHASSGKQLERPRMRVDLFEKAIIW